MVMAAGGWAGRLVGRLVDWLPGAPQLACLWRAALAMVRLATNRADNSIESALGGC